MYNFSSCGEGDKRAVNKKVSVYISFRKIDTASVIKSAARTNHAMTSPSPVKRIS